MKAKLIQILINVVSDKETRNKVLIAIFSVMAGLVILMCLPVVVIAGLDGIGKGSNQFSIDDWISQLSAGQKSEITNFQRQGKGIADAMSTFDLQEQIIKAQLIYYSYFENNHTINFTGYANMFVKAKNDKELINNINRGYNLNISYDDFMRTYTWVMNTTVNEYMFKDKSTKNLADLAAWARNAYVSGWGYKNGATGEMDELLHYRNADNAGLILGYLKYNPTDKIFEDKPNVLRYTVKGLLDTMPYEEGTVLFNGEQFGVYIGNGEVIFSSEDRGHVIKEPVSDGSWTSWVEITGIEKGTEIKFAEYEPNVKNNLGLVQWAIQAYENGWGYVYGTHGKVLTESILQDRAAMFGYQVTNYMSFIRQNWMGKRTADCVGLIKGYGWYNADTGKITIGSNGMADVTANGMFEAATVKGSINTIPEVPGLAVWQKGHIGIYVGNGEVIEAKGTQYGVVKTQLANSSWTHWLQIPYISYVE